MNKKVYFSGSIRGGRVDATLYQRIIQHIKQSDYVLTEHIGKANMSMKAQIKEIDIHIYKRDTEWIRSCDLLIAECTCPSLGVGYELAYAEEYSIPVYIFYNKGKSNISAMLNGNSYFTIIPYEKEEEIYPVIDSILGNDNEVCSPIKQDDITIYKARRLTETQKRVLEQGLKAKKMAENSSATTSK